MSGLVSQFGGIAQFGRAPVLQTGCRGFDACYLHQSCPCSKEASRTPNPAVLGSIPFCAANFAGLAEWMVVKLSEKHRVFLTNRFRGLGRMARRQPSKLSYTGSIPVARSRRPSSVGRATPS